MAEFGREQITVTRTRYLLRTPSNGTELSKALSAAARALASELSVDWEDIPDNALTVTVEDDDIVISWERTP
ncbi:hypothetical protein [Longimicrobium sp.]|jgi:hypothetical protein|uniref:hypothetical protein n=1 Tax=Longimicrobium sp. TaxID=2029185 RepID=UPI002ED9C5DE